MLEFLQVADGVIGAGLCAGEVVHGDGDGALGRLFGGGLRVDERANIRQRGSAAQKRREKEAINCRRWAANFLGGSVFQKVVVQDSFSGNTCGESSRRWTHSARLLKQSGFGRMSSMPMAVIIDL